MPRRRFTDDGEAGRKAPPAGTVRGAALSLLGRRDYTALELTRKLADRGFGADDISNTIAQLTASGLLNDRRSAMAHARTASKIKGRGPLRITRELQARGVGADVIREATADLTDTDVTEAIERFLARKRVARPVPREQRTRLYQQLLRRGFPSRLISAALGRVDTDDE